MLKTYVVGGASDLIKGLTPKFQAFGLTVIGHLDYEKARSGGAKRVLPESTQAIVILSDMINHSCCNNYVKEAKRRGIYHLLLPRKTSFWPRAIEKIIPLDKRLSIPSLSTPRPQSATVSYKPLPTPSTVPDVGTGPIKETWSAALKAIPEYLTLATTLKEINTVIEVVASDYQVSNNELKHRWKEVAGKSVSAIRAVAKLPDVNSKVLVNMFGISMGTAAAYLAHASRLKLKKVTVPNPPLETLLETLTVTGKLPDIQRLQKTLCELQRTGQVSSSLTISVKK